MRKLNKELDKEKQLLDRLVTKEFGKGGIRAPSAEVLAQSQKVDKIILTIEKDAAKSEKG